MAAPLITNKRKTLPYAPVVKEKATRGDIFLMVFFLVAMFGGAFRKWVVESSVVGNVILLVQMVIPFLMFAFREGRAQSPFARHAGLSLYFFYLLLQVFSPYQLTLFHGILGILVHGLFWLGVFFYFTNRHLFSPARYIPMLLVLVGAEVVLAFVQYTLPARHILNKYATETVKQVAVIADGVRVSGTFSYLSGYTAFLLFYPFFTWALIRLRYPTWVIATVVVLGGVAGTMTGSRSGVGLYIAFTGAILVYNYPLRQLGALLGRLILPVVIMIAVAQLFQEAPLTRKINKAYENFANRVIENRERGEESRRLVWDFTYFRDIDPFHNIITGVGTGSTYQGATILFGTSTYVRSFGYVEGEFVRLVLEGGLLLLLLKVIMTTLLVYHFVVKVWYIRLLLWITLIYGAPIVFNVHNGTFLMLGIILIDNIIWRQQQEAKTTQSVTPADVPVPEKPIRAGYPQVTDPVPQPQN